MILSSRVGVFTSASRLGTMRQLSSRVPERLALVLEDEAMRIARSVRHPNSKIDVNLGEIGYVKNCEVGDITSESGEKVLNLTINISNAFPGSNYAKSINEEVEKALSSKLSPKVVEALGDRVKVKAHAKMVKGTFKNSKISSAGKGLANVSSILAVASGKGGVGKSTVSVNTAYAMSMSDSQFTSQEPSSITIGGFGSSSVGLLDCDIYGPSLPRMVSPADDRVFQQGDGTINPVDAHGVRAMSYGYVSPRDASGRRGGAVLRGPMVSQITQQLLTLTAWGQLDHLVLDLPPGTGDVNITVGQAAPLSGALIVTTPQQLAIMDVLKGMDMFSALKVPVLGLVLNMAQFVAPDTGTTYYPFGRSSEEQLLRLLGEHGIGEDRLFCLPMDPALSEAGDSGLPHVLNCPGDALSAVYRNVARAMATDIEEVEIGRMVAGARAAEAANRVGASFSTLSVAGNALKLRVFDSEGALETTLQNKAVRDACKCAACVDEMSGKQMYDPSRTPDDIKPVSITPSGNYGVAIEWSDGHKSGIYSYDLLKKIAGGKSTLNDQPPQGF